MHTHGYAGYMQPSMVAEPGSGSARPGLPAAACGNPALDTTAPSFGPFYPGGSTPGRWSQVQALGNFTNSLARKLEEWANEIGLWRRKADGRITQLEAETQKLGHDLIGVKTVVEA